MILKLENFHAQIAKYFPYVVDLAQKHGMKEILLVRV